MSHSRSQLSRISRACSVSASSRSGLLAQARRHARDGQGLAGVPHGGCRRRDGEVDLLRAYVWRPCGEGLARSGLVGWGRGGAVGAGDVTLACEDEPPQEEGLWSGHGASRSTRWLAGEGPAILHLRSERTEGKRVPNRVSVIGRARVGASPAADRRSPSRAHPARRLPGGSAEVGRRQGEWRHHIDHANGYEVGPVAQAALPSGSRGELGDHVPQRLLEVRDALR